MLDTGLRKAIQDSLRQSCLENHDAYETKRLAYIAAARYGREQGLLGEPLTLEEQAALSVAVETVISQTPRSALLAVVSLEFIAENYHMYKRLQGQGKITTPSPGTERYAELLGRDKSRPWVARITGFDLQYGFKRSFMRGQIDYSQASSNGSRGVYLHFWLGPGVYEVNERTSWRHVKRHFIRVEGLAVTAMTREEVEGWLRDGQGDA